MFFRYLQFRHAFRVQFPYEVVLATHSVDSLLTAKNIDRTLSSIYLQLTCKDTSKMSGVSGLAAGYLCPDRVGLGRGFAIMHPTYDLG